MSYFIIPKKHTGIKLNPTFSKNKNTPIISFSLQHYINDVKKQIENIPQSEEDDYSIEFISKTVNPYEYIFSNVPGSKFSVGKIKPKSEIFYSLMEIVHTFYLFEPFNEVNIKTIHFGQNTESTIECINILREEYEDVNLNFTLEHPEINGFKIIPGVDKMSIDFLFFELNQETYMNTDYYVVGLIVILCNILYYQCLKGISIIKFDNIYDSPTLDIIYILSSMYEKVYIIKPNASNIGNNERYIVCKNFILDYTKILEYTKSLDILKTAIKKYIDFEQRISINSLIELELPYYFLNKIEESNIIIGHQQIEYYDQIISIIKNKNRDDKIETFKKNNIQKCIQWCEKHKIPYNKFIDKVNIFLPYISSSDEVEVDVK